MLSGRSGLLMAMARGLSQSPLNGSALAGVCPVGNGLVFSRGFRSTSLKGLLNVFVVCCLLFVVCCLISFFFVLFLFVSFVLFCFVVLFHLFVLFMIFFRRKKITLSSNLTSSPLIPHFFQTQTSTKPKPKNKSTLLLFLFLFAKIFLRTTTPSLLGTPTPFSHK